MEKRLVFPVYTVFCCMILSIETKLCKCWFRQGRRQFKMSFSFDVKLAVFLNIQLLLVLLNVFVSYVECAVLGFSYLFFIQPWIWSHCVLCAICGGQCITGTVPLTCWKFFSVLASIIIPPVLHTHILSSVAYP